MAGVWRSFPGRCWFEVMNDELGILAPDAVATYAAMLRAVEKPCPNEQLLAVVNDEELLKLITRAYYYAGVPDAKRMAVAFIASQQDSESGE